MPNMALRLAMVAAVLTPTLCIVPASIGLDNLMKPSTMLKDKAYVTEQTIDAALNWGNKLYLFKGTNWISYDRTLLTVDSTFPRSIMQGFPELADWQQCDAPSPKPSVTSTNIGAAIILPADASRVISPDKSLAVFFKGTSADKKDTHVAAFEATGLYGKFIGAYPSCSSGNAESAGIFPAAGTGYYQFLNDLGISPRLLGRSNGTSFYETLGVPVNVQAGISFTAPLPFYTRDIKNDISALMTYVQLDVRTPPLNPVLAQQAVPIALAQDTTDPTAVVPMVARTLAERWLPSFRAMVPCFEPKEGTSFCTAAAGEAHFFVFSNSVFWGVSLKVYDGTGDAPAGMTTCGATCKQSYLMFWSDAAMNQWMAGSAASTSTTYSQTLNWPKIIDIPGLGDTAPILQFCEPKNTLALAYMTISLTPVEQKNVQPTTVTAQDGSLVHCLEATGEGQKQLNFKLYSNSNQLIYQGSAPTTTRAKKNKLCLRIEDTTPACDFAITHMTRPPLDRGAVTGKVFLTTTSAEIPADERKYQYQREKKEIMMWQYSQSVF